MEKYSLYVAIVSLFISIVFSYVAYNASVKSNELSIAANKLAQASNNLSESQKTAALVSLLAPSASTTEEWRLFIEYLIRNDKLPALTEQDRELVESLSNRLQIKARIVDGRIRLER